MDDCQVDLDVEFLDVVPERLPGRRPLPDGRGSLSRGRLGLTEERWRQAV